MDAALECFVERGFHGTAMPQIARRANIAAGTIYHYFASKDALVNAVFRMWKAAVAQRVFTAFPQSAPARDKFRVTWMEMAAFAREFPAAFAFLELHHHSSYLDDESRGIDQRLKDFSRAMIRQAQAEGHLKKLDPSVLMELVFGAFIGMMRADWEQRISLTEEVVEAAEQACWDAVAVHPGPPVT